MQQPNNQERYDIAKSRLLLMIGHYAELIRDELRRPAPDAVQIKNWEDAQQALEDTDATLSAQDTGQVNQIIAAYRDVIPTIMKRQ